MQLTEISSNQSELVVENRRLLAELVARDVELAAQAAEVAKLTVSTSTFRQLYLDLLEQYRRLELGLLGQKAEKLPPDEAQLTLAILGEILNARGAHTETTESSSEVGAHERKKPTGRKPLPENLPRIQVEVIPPEVQREGTDAYERIGEEVSEVIERRRASIVVVETIRPKFVLRDRDRTSTEVMIAEPPELPIPRGLAGPGMLADTIVHRWQDHLPLNRLEKIYARDGLELARSTMCGWHEQLGALVTPLIAAMWCDALRQPYLCTDATGVLVQAKEKCKRAHFWVVIAPERHVIFNFSRKHDKAAVDAMLADYRGFLVADAHGVYDHLYADGRVVEVSCWAHARRYFFKAMSSDPERARYALALIGELFRIERLLDGKPHKRKRDERRKHSAPVLKKFFDWCDAEFDQVVEETPIFKGLRYARNQRAGLKQFLEDGRLPLHNNGSELQLRRQAVGRKNWLFVGSDSGGQVNALFVTLLASCQMHGIEPWAYLRDLFCLLPEWPARHVLELAPVNWRKTLEDEKTQQRLAANIFRQATFAS